jgi:hypothetical protein
MYNIAASPISIAQHPVTFWLLSFCTRAARYAPYKGQSRDFSTGPPGARATKSAEPGLAPHH